MRWVWDSVKFIYNWPDSDQLMTHSVLDLFLDWISFCTVYLSQNFSLSLSISGEDSKMSIYECPNSTNWWHTQMLTHQVSFISCIIKKQPLQNQWLLGKQSTDSSGETRPTDTTTNGRELCRTSPIENRNLIFLSNLEQVHTLSRIIVIRQFRSACTALFYHGLLINFFMLWGHSFYRQFHSLSHLYFRVIDFRFVR